jgi:chemotaxis signal transduction protein
MEIPQAEQALQVEHLEPAETQILVRLGSYSLAVPLRAIQAVERPRRFTAVPFAAPWLAGVTAVDGNVVSVVDLGAFAGMGRAGRSPGARLLVTRAAGVTAALLVDGVTKLAATPAAREAVPARDGPLARWWCGAHAVDGEIVPALDVDALFAAAEFHAYQAF